ncbi:ScbA/BarX family gamma-butyrolactone biosynthesis protein [Streptomyces sp. ME02-8801-2C]|uniref:ScbA/BarX family gamma-butyrolactone biosynthesis protein n=1 Tax=Streptomyces sp. ME02-8801-2C TaxID=3028680 RepID=UPI0029A11A10|nr:ScbA/BarX family gamma-butyrolactone biosynthesis protein [Streptomyces sp. ME02-8801-2C]MDX3455658.1 ScbA/BarX family gamma-butyrolactone biosynthesis protein [Streptomyces sp. ME02-8801-2C]
MSVSMLPAVPVPADGARGGLNFDRTVPRQLVHRASVQEVFLTDGVHVGADRYLVGAQLPRHHALYRPDVSGRCDFMLLAETVRQAGIFVIHRYRNVPLNHHFVFRSLALRIDDPAALRVGATPLGAVLDVSVTQTRAPDARRFDARLDVTIEVDGRPCAYASVAVLVVDARRYGMLRRRAGRDTAPADTSSPSAEISQTASPATRISRTASQPALTAPVIAGRPRADVLLRASADGDPSTWLLHLDPGHPGYFEHPSDHVPGMVLLEAFRQAGHLAAGRDTVLTSLNSEFESFAELCQPVTIKAADRRAGMLHLTAVQGERTLARAEAVFTGA